MIHGAVGAALLAVVAAAGVGAPSSYSPGSGTGAHPTAIETAAAAGSIAASRSPAPTTRDRCGEEPRDAAGWSRLFRSQEGTWAGGDGASSTRLPDGRLLWVFGDTFTGGVDDAGARSSDAAMVHNSLVITEGTCWTTTAQGKDALPGRDGTWLWPTHAVVTKDADPATVVVFAQRLASDRTDAFGFRRVGAAMAVVSIPSNGIPTVGALMDIPASDVLWGAALASRGDTLWIYGTRPRAGAFGRDLLLARAPVGDVTDVAGWTYRTTDGWSRDASRAGVVLPTGVSTVLAARATSSGVLLVTKPEEFLDARVVALQSPHPWGPWTSHLLLRTPSTQDVLTYSPGLVASLPGGADVLVVSRTSPSLDVLMHDAQASMPDFHDVGRLTE